MRKRIEKEPAVTSLADIKKVLKSAPAELSANDAKSQGYIGNLLRRRAWPAGEFIWYRHPVTKHIEKDGIPNKDLYAPISFKFLLEKKLDKFGIKGHWNKWCGDQIEIGYRFMGDDKTEKDWEVIT